MHKIKRIYGKDKDAYDYMACVFLGYAIYEAFSRIALTLENNRSTWNIHYVSVVLFAFSGLVISALSLRKLYSYAVKISKGASMKCIRIPFDDDCP